MAPPAPGGTLLAGDAFLAVGEAVGPGGAERGGSQPLPLVGPCGGRGGLAALLGTDRQTRQG